MSIKTLPVFQTSSTYMTENDPPLTLIFCISLQQNLTRHTNHHHHYYCTHFRNLFSFLNYSFQVITVVSQIQFKQHPPPWPLTE